MFGFGAQSDESSPDEYGYAQQSSIGPEPTEDGSCSGLWDCGVYYAGEGAELVGGVFGDVARGAGEIVSGAGQVVAGTAEAGAGFVSDTAERVVSSAERVAAAGSTGVARVVDAGGDAAADAASAAAKPFAIALTVLGLGGLVAYMATRK